MTRPLTLYADRVPPTKSPEELLVEATAIVNEAQRIAEAAQAELVRANGMIALADGMAERARIAMGLPPKHERVPDRNPKH